MNVQYELTHSMRVQLWIASIAVLPILGCQIYFSELSRSLFLQYVVPHVASLFLFSVMCATYLVGAWRYLLSNICLSS